MKVIFEDKNITITDTETTGLIIRNRRYGMVIRIESTSESIRASVGTPTAPGLEHASGRTRDQEYLEVRKSKV